MTNEYIYIKVHLNSQNNKSEIEDILNLLIEEKIDEIEINETRSKAHPSSLGIGDLDPIINIILHVHLLTTFVNATEKIAIGIFNTIKRYFDYKKKIGEYTNDKEEINITIEKKNSKVNIRLKLFDVEEKKEFITSLMKISTSAD